MHAFTGSGLNWQLRAFVMVFTLACIDIIFCEI